MQIGVGIANAGSFVEHLPILIALTFMHVRRNKQNVLCLPINLLGFPNRSKILAALASFAGIIRAKPASLSAMCGQ